MKGTPGRLLSNAFLRDDLQVWIERQALAREYPLHWHEFYELTFVMSGHGNNVVNGVAHALVPGDLCLLTPTDFHSIGPTQGTTLHLYNLNFPQALLSKEIMQLIFSAKCASFARFDEPHAYARMLARFESIDAEYTTPTPGSRIVVQSEINCMLVEWQRHQPCSAAAQQTPLRTERHCHPGIQKSLIYIQHHFRQPLSLDEAARQAHLSSNYYSELFRKSTGVTFQTYLQRLRLQFAHALLRTSPLPVTEVSYASGFNTLTHFERAFRVQFGMTPSDTQKLQATHR